MALGQAFEGTRDQHFSFSKKGNFFFQEIFNNFFKKKIFLVKIGTNVFSISDGKHLFSNSARLRGANCNFGHVRFYTHSFSD